MSHGFDDEKNKVEMLSRASVEQEMLDYKKEIDSTIDAMKESIRTIGLTMYPVGSIYLSVRNVNPQSFWGGIWVAWGSGRVPVGVNKKDSSFDEVEKIGGSKYLQEHDHATTEHSHHIEYYHDGGYGPSDPEGTSIPKPVDKYIYTDVNGASSSEDTRYVLAPLAESAIGTMSVRRVSKVSNPIISSKEEVKVKKTGDGNSGNLQPYITCYMWKRVS